MKQQCKSSLKLEKWCDELEQSYSTQESEINKLKQKLWWEQQALDELIKSNKTPKGKVKQLLRSYLWLDKWCDEIGISLNKIWGSGFKLGGQLCELEQKLERYLELKKRYDAIVEHGSAQRVQHFDLRSQLSLGKRTLKIFLEWED